MTQQARETLRQQAQALFDAPTCSAEARDAAQRWIAAAGTDAEPAETARFLAELEEDIMPIDRLIAFAGSAQGAAYFGAQTAAGIAAHAKEIQAAGARYCDCPACAAAEAILSHKQEYLA